MAKPNKIIASARRRRTSSAPSRPRFSVCRALKSVQGGLPTTKYGFSF